MIEEPETIQTQEIEVEGEVQGTREDAEEEENKVGEEMIKGRELKVAEMDEHRTMPEHPGRDSDSGDSEPENETEKWPTWCLSSKKQLGI